MKIAILAGGASAERAVSACSGYHVAQALARRGHAVTLLDPFLPPEPSRCTYTNRAPLPLTGAAVSQQIEERLDAQVCAVLKEADVAFLCLHGGAGEDGRLQAELSAHRIPYTGSAPDACRLAMDKAATKACLCAHGIGVPQGVLLSKTAYRRHRQTSPDTLPPDWQSIMLPCVCKPNDGGSSIGVAPIFEPSELRSYFGQAQGDVLAEEYIDGAEYSVGILEGSPLAVVQILPSHAFYDYDNKYRAGAARELCPAPLVASETARLRDTALAVHRALGLGDYSRIDFLVRQSDGALLCLEANALPGMTPTSLLPLCAQACGLDFDALCACIARLGAEAVR